MAKTIQQHYDNLIIGFGKGGKSWQPGWPNPAAIVRLFEIINISEKEYIVSLNVKQMKITFFLLSFLFPFLFTADAQEKKDSLSPYLFPEFIQGKVKMKNGDEASTLLNYYTITQEMIFEQQGNRLALAELHSIDTVIIAGRKFIPADDKFYEVLTYTTVSLLARHSAVLIHEGSPTAYGGNSNFATSLSKISSAGRVYGLKLPESYTTLPRIDYWLKKKYNYYEANNLKQILRVFPGKAEAIQDFIKANHIDIKKQDDLVKLILFCHQ